MARNDPPSTRPLPPRAAQIAAEARTALMRRMGRTALPVWPSGQLIEIEPGVRVATAAVGEDVRVLVFDLQAQGDGTFRPVARVRGQRVRLAGGTLRTLGIAASYKTLRRLIMAGFIRGEQFAPGMYQMDLESYFEHELATADPEFWTQNNEANAKKLRLAVSGSRLGCGSNYRRRGAQSGGGPLS